MEICLSASGGRSSPLSHMLVAVMTYNWWPSLTLKYKFLQQNRFFYLLFIKMTRLGIKFCPNKISF